MPTPTSRRRFLASSTSLAAAALAGPAVVSAADSRRPALLGGTPVHTGPWPAWPVWDPAWEEDFLRVGRSGRWNAAGGGPLADFERRWAELLGARRCLATSSGTTALITALHVLGIDAGDEVIVSPYTFVATYNAILAHKALPVLADTDPATLNVDPASIADRITDRTRAIVPVHIFGLPCDMDPINALARARGLRVLEDACQAWLAEYRGRKCGTLGDLGCFSFQQSKHIPAGEGGAITGMDEDLVDRCNSYHNCGRSVGRFQGNGCFTRGSNFRLTQFQGVLLLWQIEKLVAETARRREVADYLNARLGTIPGITPVRVPAESRGVYHLYPVRYDARAFAGLPRDAFLRALAAEGVPGSGVYKEQYFDGLLDEAIASRGFQRLFPAARLKAYRESFQELRGNRETCASVVALPQTVLLAGRAALDQVVEACAKLQAQAPALAAAARAKS
jgi:dTDP-4-amino-4,6-dideoxygalactose transaminase